MSTLILRWIHHGVPWKDPYVHIHDLVIPGTEYTGLRFTMDVTFWCHQAAFMNHHHSRHFAQDGPIPVAAIL